MSADDRWIGHILNRNYRIDSRLGKGGQAVVYRGVDLLLQEAIAIKMFRKKGGDESNLERFKREARHQMKLVHQHIVGTRAIVEEEDEYFIVMEYIDGTDLGHLISVSEEFPRLPLYQIKSIFQEALSGLGYAHSQGIIHRDIKPANIMLTRDYKVKLADFGLARQLSDHRLTQVGQLLGTPAYTAPEILHGESNFDPRCDIYSIGVTLYETICGTTPFLNPGEVLAPYELLGRSMFMEPETPREREIMIPEALDDLIMRSIAKEPEQRYSTCEEFREALLETIDDKEAAWQGKDVHFEDPGDRDTTIIESPYTSSSQSLSLTTPARLPEQDQHTEVSMEAIPEYVAEGVHTRESETQESLPQMTVAMEAADDTFDSRLKADGSGGIVPEPSDARLPKRRTPTLGLIITLGFCAFAVGVLMLGYKQYMSNKGVKGITGKNPRLRPKVTGTPPRFGFYPQKLPGVPMVYVSKGSFLQGADKGGHKVSKPQRRIALKSFWIDKYEVTVGQYRACVQSKACVGSRRIKLSGDPTLPVSRVTWPEALQFCKWMGKTLPTEAQWEKAARGVDGRTFPWGNRRFPRNNKARCEYANTCGCARGPLSAVQNPRSLGHSPYDAHDMSGNVAEWTLDCYSSRAYRILPRRDPVLEKPVCTHRVLRGGSYSCDTYHFRVTYSRLGKSALSRRRDIGFRCAYNGSRP